MGGEADLESGAQWPSLAVLSARLGLVLLCSGQVVGQE